MRQIKKRAGDKGDSFLRLTAVQIAASVLVFLMLFLLMKRDDAMVLRIRNEIDALMAQDWDIAAAAREKMDTVFSGGQEDGTGAVPVIGGSAAPSEGDTVPAQGGAAVLLAAATSAAESDPTGAVKRFYDSSAPVMPVSGPVTSDYGYRVHPIYGGESFHSGRDIAADEGTDIRAVYDGEVIAVGVGESSGNYIKIDHGNGLVALYCHCSAVYAEEGDLVRKGDTIAAVGQTGAATGPHLHFETRVDGELRDPSAVLDIAENVS